MNAPARAAVFATLVLAVATVGAASAAAGADETTVESVTYGGQSVVTTPGSPLYVWQSDEHEFSVRVVTTDGVEAAAVCLLTDTAGRGPRELACRNVSLDAGSDRTVALSLDPWPADLTGARTLGAVVRNRSTGRRVASEFVTVVVIERTGDRDGDGLTNQRELERGTDLALADTDGDGLDDAAEVRTYDTSPMDADSDADGLTDGAEVNVHHTDPTSADTDGDGIADGREVELGTVPTRADTDGDGLDDGVEVDRYQTNATLADTDGDGLPDGAEVDRHGTDPTRPDTDGDGLADGTEVHVHGTNPLAADTDGDGLSDRAEIERYFTDPTNLDTDGDGLGDADEVRDHETDPLAPDTDGDGLADGREVSLGSDPTDPASTAQPGPVRRALWTVADRPLLVAVGGGALALVGLVAVTWRFGDGFPVDGLARHRERETGAGADSVDGDGTTATDDDESADATSVGDDATLAGTDAAVMTNEERVAHLLEAHDGRMLQTDMVEAADWSKATVSRVLSRMEEEGTVSRVDIGRGNLVTWPEDEPPSASSPFSE